MRAVAQRVNQAHVTVADEVVGQIGRGLLVYLAAGHTDGHAEVDWMANKLAGLRVFADESERMTADVRDVGGAVLVVPQFTLYGDVRRGRRPSFDAACPPERARVLFDDTCEALRCLGLVVATGRFQADMAVHGVVDGPVTILIDSDKRF